MGCWGGSRRCPERSRLRSALASRGPIFRTTLLAAFGLIALLLASIGIYRVVAYTVAQRSKEIGIGLAGAFAVTTALRNTLYQVSATDPLTFAAVSALLLGTAALASWASARRATRIDPMVSLRAD